MTITLLYHTPTRERAVSPLSPAAGKSEAWGRSCWFFWGTRMRAAFFSLSSTAPRLARPHMRVFSTGALLRLKAPPPLRLTPHALAPAAKKTISVTFVKPDGTKQTVKAPVGDSMLEVAHANKIDIEGAFFPPTLSAVSFPPVFHPQRPPPRRLRRGDGLLHVPPLH